ncbi:4Fe-4S double cluster binding domain-containing protein [Candidatus Bipolaricaulota bacterium]
MSSAPSAERILEAIERRGWAARFVPGKRRFDLWGELEERFERGEFNMTYFEERVRYFEKAAKELPVWVRSFLIVAIPDPKFRIRFGWRGREVALLIPQGFVHFHDRAESLIEEAMRTDFSERPVRTSGSLLPRKLLAARTGLSRYGRNNLAYVDGMGSYHRLSCLATDIRCDDSSWQEAAALDACESCGACIRTCPAGAIDPDRFLIRVERCITYWHERAPGVAYPNDADYSWQEHFMGCTKCQDVCPQNRQEPAVEETGPPFTEEETTALVRGVALDDLAPETIEKLRQHDILQYLGLLPRNLPTALENASTAADSHPR